MAPDSIQPSCSMIFKEDGSFWFFESVDESKNTILEFVAKQSKSLEQDHKITMPHINL
jgi:hypothetical protein